MGEWIAQTPDREEGSSGRFSILALIISIDCPRYPLKNGSQDPQEGYIPIVDYEVGLYWSVHPERNP